MTHFSSVKASSTPGGGRLGRSLGVWWVEVTDLREEKVKRPSKVQGILSSHVYRRFSLFQPLSLPFSQSRFPMEKKKGPKGIDLIELEQRVGLPGGVLCIYNKTKYLSTAKSSWLPRQEISAQLEGLVAEILEGFSGKAGGGVATVEFPWASTLACQVYQGWQGSEMSLTQQRDWVRKCSHSARVISVSENCVGPAGQRRLG